MTFIAEPPPRDVVIRAWGATAQDAADAVDSARRAPAAHRWTVLDVEFSTQPPCDIPSRDPLAIAQATDYDSAWAAYPATGSADTPGRRSDHTARQSHTTR